MSLKDIVLNPMYRSYGEDSISSMINPLLSHAKIYKRSVGFFSSSSLNITSEGITEIVKKGGKIQFITSPYISSDDKAAIELGYKNKEDVIRESFCREFEDALSELKNENLEMLSELIAAGYIDIKIVKTKGLGDYHDKFAIIEDENNNIVAFNGSSNESQNGLYDNYERIFVFKNWVDDQKIYVDDDIKEFESLWNGTNEFNETYSFMDAVSEAIIKVRNVRNNGGRKLKPFDYQNEAIQKWVDNGYKGFFVMATGTGKTLTSLFSLEKILEKEPLFVVIAVPYKHLVVQWMDDVEKLFPDAMKFKVAGEILNWDHSIKNAIFMNKVNKEKKPIIIVSTMKSFYSDRFKSVFQLNNLKTCLIVDEAHNFLNKIYEQKYFIDYDYKIGLSATPVFGSDSKKTDDLLDFFGGEVYSLPIEKAIGKYLVNYDYHPLFTYATEEDEKNFAYQTKRMASCIKDNIIIDQEGYTKAYRARLRVISMAENKVLNVADYIKKINAKDHFIIYCSDGRLNDDETTSIRHLNKVVNILTELKYDPSQFTAREDMNTRIKLIDGFNNGDINTLVAIRCLDEGINIPSISKALILSSNNNYREFVQRRGRILRKYPGKIKADIYDVILLPNNCDDIAKIEFRRFYEYAKVALNRDENIKILEKYLYEYGLTYNDILFDNDYLNGGDLDD